MKLSTRTRYGTRLMLRLALSYNEDPVFLKDIAKAEDISEKYLSQIIIPLKSAGLVNSFRGAKGCYILSKSPTQITLKDIVEVLEDDFNLARCIEDPTVCRRVSICVTRDLWNKLGEKISQTLEAITLADLVEQYHKKGKKEVVYHI